MEYIFAPWREEYVKKLSKMNECIFCQALKSKDSRESLILYRGRYNFILLNKFPYTSGHLMIAPYRHLASFERAKKEYTDEMIALLKLSLKVLKKNYKPHGFNTGMNLGHSAGAGVADHYHLHVIPRWIGDSSFMPLVGNTKVTIHDLATSYKQLHPLFQKEKNILKKGNG
ncbi:MAG: HIT domain-containing protein [Candidatus Aminicenantaceae bacterium]